jgi:hypothetical protein
LAIKQQATCSSKTTEHLYLSRVEAVPTTTRKDDTAAERNNKNSSNEITTDKHHHIITTTTMAFSSFINPQMAYHATTGTDIEYDSPEPHVREMVLGKCVAPV